MSSFVCAVRVVGGRSWLVAVVAVGKSSEVAGPVGVDSGGGWNGTIVVCLLSVDDNIEQIKHQGLLMLALGVAKK